jgi:hypothetical protein
MLFLSNASGHWPTQKAVHGPVDNRAVSTVSQPGPGDEIRQPIPASSQASRPSSGADLLWLIGSESPIDRKTLLDELNAERFGLPGKAAK